jgi:hypothetical protein
MKYIITLTTTDDVEDVFEIAKLLQPIADVKQLRAVSVIPRPEQPPVLPGPPQGAPGQARSVTGGLPPTFSVPPQPARPNG